MSENIGKTQQDFSCPSQEAIGMVHIKGYMYKWIMEDLGKIAF